MKLPYPYSYSEARDPGNYSVAPTNVGHAGGLNQQAAAFTPRGNPNSAQFASGNHNYPVNSSVDPQMLMEHFQRLAINARQA
jgi:hypothetical protein